MDNGFRNLIIWYTFQSQPNYRSIYWIRRYFNTLRYTFIKCFSVDSLNFVAMLIATFCYGLATHITKRYLKEMSMFQISLGTLLVGSICSGGIVLFLEEPIQILTKISWHHIGALIGIGTFGSGIAYLLYFT